MTTKSHQPLGPKQQAWVDALRSGEYKQTKFVLQYRNGFCCLGVACAINTEILDPHNVIYHSSKQWILGGSLVAHKEVSAALKLRSNQGAFKIPIELPTGEYVRSLTNLNDKANWNFNQIADFIEERAHELFSEPA